MSTQTYFITTTIPYVNAKPHIGHAQEFVLADALARFYRQKNHTVTLQSGTDDNAGKNVIAARAAGLSPHDFVNQNAEKFKELLSQLGIQPDYFVRTSSPQHAKGVAQFLNRLKSDDIFLSTYEGLYCQGCEDFYFEKDLVGGLCPDHKTPPQKTNETNVFFRLSRYQKEIFDLIESDQVKITPASKKTEILNFISAGLTDISLSRSSLRNENWGIPYPGHPDQVVYVWIDALISYLTGTGFGTNSDWQKLWNHQTNKIHVIGKNVWKFHAIYWIALLLSADLPLPNEIIIHGFLTSEGVKISKSLGNGIDTSTLISQHGSDALRFYLLHGLSYYEDADFSEDQLTRLYNSELANKFGNLVSRVFALKDKVPLFEFKNNFEEPRIDDFQGATCEAFRLIESINKEINDLRPWELLKNNNTALLISYLKNWLWQLGTIRTLLSPLIPNGCLQLTYFLDEERSLAQLYPRK